MEQGEVEATAMKHLLRMASAGIGAVVEFLTKGRRPEKTPDIEFHDTRVGAVTETPVPGFAVHRRRLEVLRMPGMAVDVAGAGPLQGAFPLGTAGLGATPGGQGRGVNCHLAPNPYRALGEGGRSQPRPLGPSGHARSGDRTSRRCDTFG